MVSLNKRYKLVDYCCGGTADTAPGNAQLATTAQDPADAPEELPPQAERDAKIAPMMIDRTASLICIKTPNLKLFDTGLSYLYF